MKIIASLPQTLLAGSCATRLYYVRAAGKFDKIKLALYDTGLYVKFNTGVKPAPTPGPSTLQANSHSWLIISSHRQESTNSARGYSLFPPLAMSFRAAPSNELAEPGVSSSGHQTALTRLVAAVKRLVYQYLNRR